jgi:hypothetical protein
MLSAVMLSAVMLSALVLSAVMLSAVMLSALVLSAVMLSAVMLSVLHFKIKGHLHVRLYHAFLQRMNFLLVLKMNAFHHGSTPKCIHRYLEMYFKFHP